MRLKEINKPIKEYRNVVTPKDEAHYRELMKTLHNLELKSASDPATMAEIKRRKMELRNWAEQNLKRESQPDAGAERADAARGMWASSKEIQSRFKTWQDFMNSEDFDEWLDDKFREDAVDTSKWKDNAITQNYPPGDPDGVPYVWKGGQWVEFIGPSKDSPTGKVAPRDVGKILTKLTKDEELSGDLQGGIIRDLSLTNRQKQGLQKINTKYGNYFGNNADPLPQGYIRARFDTGIGTDGIESDELEAALKKFGYEDMDDAEAKDEDFYDTVQEYLPITNAMTDDMAKVMGNDIDDDDKMGDALTYLDSLDESIGEDAGDQALAEDMIPNNMPGNIGDYAHEKSTGKLVRIVDYTDDNEGIYTISYGDGKGETDVTAGDLEFIDPTVHQDLDDKILDKEVDEDAGNKAVDIINAYANKLGPKSMDFKDFRIVATLLGKGKLEALGKYIYKMDTSPREYVMDIISKYDPKSWKEMYGDQEGYMSLMRPKGMADPHANGARTEGFIGKKPEYTDFLQNKLEKAMQEYDTPEKKAQRDALMKQYLAKGGSVEKIPAGQKAFVGKKLKPAFKKDKNGTPITSPGSDESVIKELNSQVYDEIGGYLAEIEQAMRYIDPPEKALIIKNAITGIKNTLNMGESVQEGAPFDGKGILQRAVFNKWISAEEWFHLKDEWQDAARELEQRYSDWPDGEGFGSSDHNFAIRDLMSIVGYEFDDQDTSGKFVVTKMPEKLEKLGITNVRMRGEPVAQEQNSDGLQPADLKRLGQTEPKIYVHKDGKTILIPKRKHNEYLAKGWKTSSLRAETQTYESKLIDKLNQRLK